MALPPVFDATGEDVDLLAVLIFSTRSGLLSSLARRAVAGREIVAGGKHMGDSGVRRRRGGNVIAVLILGTGLALVTAGSSAWAEPACATAEDEATLNARVLQTELMVAALACGEQQRYNAFVTTFKSELSQRGQLLRAYFKRVHGASGENRMNAFVTKLANEAAQRTASRPDAYCTAAARLFSEVLASSPRDLTRIAARPEISARHGYARCRSGS